MWRTYVSSQIHQMDQHQGSFLDLTDFLPHRAEVNIGIAAACIPTLLPLGRLIRDKLIVPYQSSPSSLGRLTRSLLGQGRTMGDSSRRPSFGLRKAKNSLHDPDKHECWPSKFHPFAEIERHEYEDIEMRPTTLARPKFKRRNSFYKDFK